MMITVSRATDADADDLLDWRNDATARAVSGSSEVVSAADHAAWFERVLADDSRFLYIARDDGNDELERVGMCRFDLGAHDRAEVSINLNPVFRGKGLSRIVLESGIAAFRAEVGRPVTLTASIKPSNQASVRTFEAVGFEIASDDGEFGRYVLAG